MISGAAMKKKRQAQVELFGCEPDLADALQRKADAPVSYTHLTLPTTPYV